MIKAVFSNLVSRFMPVAIVCAFAGLFKGVSFDEFWNEMEIYLLILLIPVMIYPFIGKISKWNAKRINELKKQEIAIPPIEKTPNNVRKIKVKIGLYPLIMFFVLPLYLLNLMELSTYGKILMGVEIILILVIAAGLKLQFSHIKKLKSQL